MDLLSIIERFPDNASCYAHLEKIRWGDSVKCAYCNSEKPSKIKGTNRYHCNKCHRSFSVLVGTLFESTKLPLVKWFMAIALMTNAKKGLSSYQLARDIKVNRKTAWYLQMRIRKAMDEGDDSDMMNGIIEVDETYIGGAMRNKHLKDRYTKYKNVKTGMTEKVPVLGIFQRGGKVFAKLISHADGKTIKPILKEKVDKASTLVTDGFGGYSKLEKWFSAHFIMNKNKNIHAQGEYNINSVEGFWSLLKRAVIGQYHKLSPKYAQQYVNELSFKYNNRGEDMFTILINQAIHCDPYH